MYTKRNRITLILDGNENIQSGKLAKELKKKSYDIVDRITSNIRDKISYLV